MRTFLFILVVAFLGTLAVAMAARVSAEGRALIAGMVYGALASLPASFLAFVLTRSDEPEHVTNERPGYRPMVVVNNSQPLGVQPLPEFPPLRGQAAPAASERRYRVVGE